MQVKTLEPLFDFEAMNIPTLNSNGLTGQDILSVA